MALDMSRLQHVKHLPGGVTQAQCPACAAAGHDRKGEHLRIFPDGRFGCCVYTEDEAHRKAIWQLAGATRGPVVVRVFPTPKVPSQASQTGLSITEHLNLGRLGRHFQTLTRRAEWTLYLKDVETPVPRVPKRSSLTDEDMIESIATWPSAVRHLRWANHPEIVAFRRRGRLIGWHRDGRRIYLK